MSPLRLTDNPPEKSILLRGSPSWYCFKFIKYILMLVCLMILLLIQHFSNINDNFTKAYKDNSTVNDTNTSNKTSHTLLSLVNEKLGMPEREFTYGNFNAEHKTIFRVKRASDNSLHQHDKSSINLSDLLIMYPCCTTMAIILGMEMLGQALKDPLSKTTNLILILLCIVLALVVFVISLMASLRTVQATMIILAVVSILFFLFEIADFVLLLFS